MSEFERPSAAWWVANQPDQKAAGYLPLSRS